VSTPVKPPSTDAAVQPQQPKIMLGIEAASLVDVLLDAAAINAARKRAPEQERMIHTSKTDANEEA
jgi:hypothetical protein